MASDSFDIEVQVCGCIALPEAVSAALRIGPGAHLRISLDSVQRSVILKAISEETNNISTTAVCPII